MKHVDPAFLAESRAVFLMDATCTLTDVLEAISADDALAPTRRRDLTSALRRIEALFGRPLSSLPATPATLRVLFSTATPAQLRLRPKTFANIRALAGQAVARYAPAHQAVTRRIPLTLEWRQFLDQVTVTYQRQALYRLAAYCSAMRIPPADITPDTLLGLHAALEAEEAVKRPRSILKNTISNWNRCRRSVAGWPAVTLSSPFREDPFTLPLEAFPQSFQDEIADWARRMADPDPLDPEAPDRALSPNTITHRILSFRIFASAVVRSGHLATDDVTSLAVLLTPVAFKAGLRVMLDRSDGKKTPRLHNLASMLRLVARHHCRFDDATLEDLARIARRLRPDEPRQLTAKNRDRLGQFDDPINVARLLRFPEQEAARAVKEKNPLRAARCMERALMTALLIHCGLRGRTLRELELGDFHWSGRDRCHLVIDGAKTKNHRELAFELTPEVVDLLRRHIDAYRPPLPGSESSWLFPGVNGGPRSKNAIYEAISGAIRKHTGLEMNPHLFRHALAKIAVERDPGAYVAVSRVLGHTTLDTTMGHYLGTESRAAGRHLDAILERAKDGEA